MIRLRSKSRRLVILLAMLSAMVSAMLSAMQLAMLLAMLFCSIKIIKKAQEGSISLRRFNKIPDSRTRVARMY